MRAESLWGPGCGGGYRWAGSCRSGPRPAVISRARPCLPRGPEGVPLLKGWAWQISGLGSSGWDPLGLASHLSKKPRARGASPSLSLTAATPALLPQAACL